MWVNYDFVTGSRVVFFEDFSCPRSSNQTAEGRQENRRVDLVGLE